ncbi:methionine--tRNA ligase [Patescibacteria group bacterium]|nr:methionine--tRNA ligase [Patescibacteria group bacterium]
MSKFYITTAIPYVNAAPHIGFALEAVQADVLARYHRMISDDTYFLTGVDEHGVKLYDTAKEVGMETQEFADLNAEKFKALREVLNLTNDDFVRTTSDRHKKGAQKFWMKLFENGDIYKGSYKGLYCKGCESFIPEKDLLDGKCATHQKEPQELEEENYFFKLSKYSDQIKELIKTDKLKIVPESRKNEMLNIIGEGGLYDVSFSRPKDQLPWGIDVPNDQTQVMYVWGDALTNYITALDFEGEGEKYKKYWPCDVHLIGKDILRFHAGIWIGMLLSAGEKLPEAVYVHGFVTSEGQKMSKSLGNVVDPLEYVEKYGADALRYFLMREIPTTDDGDFSHSRFVDVYNSELANGLGNLVNRVVMMTDRYLGGKVPSVTEQGEFGRKVEELLGKYHAGVMKFNLKVALETVVELINFGNKYIDDKKPWVMAKEDDSEIEVVLYNLLELLRFAAYMLKPIVPKVSEKILGRLDVEGEFEQEWGGLKTGGQVEKGELLFPRLEE